MAIACSSAQYLTHSSFTLGAGDYTIAVWMNYPAYPASNASHQVWGSTTANDFCWGHYGTDYWAVGKQAATNEAYCTSNAGHVANTWEHYAVTRQSNAVNMFRNGSSLTMADGTDATNYPQTGNFRLNGYAGAVPSITYSYEDFRVYQRALTSQEIAQLAAGYRGPLGGEKIWLPMDDFSEPFYSSGALSSVTGAAKSRIYDRSGNGNHGTAHGGATIQPVTAAPWTNPNGSTATDYAFVLDGTNDYIDCGSYANLDNIWVSGSGATVTGWFKVDSVNSSNEALVSKFSSGPNVGWYIYKSTGVFVFAAGNGGGWYCTGLSSGTWTHFAVTYDGGATANNPEMYINGSSCALTEYSAPNTTAVDDSAKILEINRMGAAYNPSSQSVEDFRVYRRILSAGEIATLAGGSRAKLGGEVLWLSASHRQGVGQFDAIPLNADNVVPDLSGNGNHGTPSGRPTGAASIAPRMSGWIPQ